MKIHLLTKKQSDLRDKLTFVAKILLAPLWLPLLGVFYIFSYGADFIEEQILDRGENLLDDVMVWLVRKRK